MDRRAWWATPPESRTLLSDFQIHIHMLACSLSLCSLSFSHPSFVPPNYLESLENKEQTL